MNGVKFFLIAGLFFGLLPGASAQIDVKTVKGGTGVTAWFVENHNVPLVYVNMTFKGGSAYAPAGKEGLSDLMARLLTAGAGGVDKFEFQEKLDDLGVKLDVESGIESIDLSFQAVTENAENLQAALRLLNSVLTRPNFSPEDLEHEKTLAKAALKQLRSNGGYQMKKLRAEKLFGAHPYAREYSVTESSVDAIAVDDLRRFFTERLARDNVKVSIAGDLTPEAAAAALDLIFNGVTESAAKTEIPAVEAPAAGLAQTFVHKLSNPQSNITLVQPGISLADEDYLAFTVMNHILGGGSMSSRLYTEVREKRGLTYGISSYPEHFDKVDLIAVTVATRNEKVGETVGVVKAEWRKIVESGVSPKEFEEAMAFLTGSYIMRFTSLAGISSYLLMLQKLNKDIAYVNGRNSLLKKVTLQDVNRVAKKVLKPDQLMTVISGEPNLAPSSSN